jgi:hypothetical protein
MLTARLGLGAGEAPTLVGTLALIDAAVSFPLTRHALGEETPVAVGMASSVG